MGIAIRFAEGAVTDKQAEAAKAVARISVDPKWRRCRDPTTAHLVIWPEPPKPNHNERAMWTAIARMAVEVLLCF
jgi:hypothetical protein